MEDFSRHPSLKSARQENPHEGQSGSLAALVAGYLRTLLVNAAVRYGLAVLAALLLAGLIYLTISEDGFIKTRALRQEKVRLEGELAKLTEENDRLRQRIERIKNDPAYVEDEARKKLGLVKPNEIIYRLAEEPDLGYAPPDPSLETGD